jgi:hypothetical protein
LLSKKLNNSLFISFYLLSLIAGSNFMQIKVGEYHLFMGRILTFILPILLFSRENLKFFINAKYGKWLSFIVSLIIVWSIFSFFWAKDIKSVMVNTFYIFTGVLNGFILVCLAFDKNYELTPQFLKAWHISWLCLVIFAYLEIFFGFHIKGHYSDFLQMQEPGISAFDAAISLFDGPNEFAIYLVISIPFSTYLFYRKPLYFLGILLISLQMMYRNDAKLCLIALVFFLFSFACVNQKKLFDSLKQSMFPNYKYLLLVISFIAFMLLSNKLVMNKSEHYSLYSSFESNYSSVKNQELSSSSSTKNSESNRSKNALQNLPKNEEQQNSLTSFQIRINLIINGFNFLKEHPLRGIGCGNFEYYMQNSPNVLPTRNVINSHNWVVQLLCEYGIIIGGVYWIMLLILFISNCKYYFNVTENNMQQFLAVNLLVTLVIISNVSSSFASNPLNWTIFFLLHIAFKKRENSL